MCQVSRIRVRRFTQVDIDINVNQIVSMEKFHGSLLDPRNLVGGCLITLSTGKVIHTIESHAEILKMYDEAMKGK